MKKIICLLLSLGLIFTLFGCSDDNKENKNTIDLEYYAKLGEMPEAKYSLGDKPEKIIEELSAEVTEYEKNHQEDIGHNHDHDEQQPYFEVTEGKNNVLLDNGSLCYYYNKANKDKGISYIVNYDKAFGFELGTVSLEVKESLNKINFTEEVLSQENAFFADYVLNGTVLKAEFEKSTVIFVFQENELFATAIYNNNWSN